MPSFPERIPVPEDGFPIPLPPDQFRGAYCARSVCDACGRNWHEDPSTEHAFLIGEGVAMCPEPDCAGNVVWAYTDGDECGGCGTLRPDWKFPVKDDHGAYCSRTCMLQAEYARSLT